MDDRPVAGELRVVGLRPRVPDHGAGELLGAYGLLDPVLGEVDEHGGPHVLTGTHRPVHRLVERLSRGAGTRDTRIRGQHRDGDVEPGSDHCEERPTGVSIDRRARLRDRLERLPRRGHVGRAHGAVVAGDALLGAGEGLPCALRPLPLGRPPPRELRQGLHQLEPVVQEVAIAARVRGDRERVADPVFPPVEVVDLHVADGLVPQHPHPLDGVGTDSGRVGEIRVQHRHGLLGRGERLRALRVGALVEPHLSAILRVRDDPGDLLERDGAVRDPAVDRVRERRDEHVAVRGQCPLEPGPCFGTGEGVLVLPGRPPLLHDLVHGLVLGLDRELWPTLPMHVRGAEVDAATHEGVSDCEGTPVLRRLHERLAGHGVLVVGADLLPAPVLELQRQIPHRLGQDLEHRVRCRGATEAVEQAHECPFPVSTCRDPPPRGGTDRRR